MDLHLGMGNTLIANAFKLKENIGFGSFGSLIINNCFLLL
jgi:hypothetical protein